MIVGQLGRRLQGSGCNCMGQQVRERSRGMRAYEMPAAFQANAILTEIVGVGLRSLIVS